MWCRTCGCQSVGQTEEQAVQRFVTVVDGRTSIVGEWDRGSHSLQVLFGFDGLGLGGFFGA
jgi:hypothetical protein